MMYDQEELYWRCVKAYHTRHGKDAPWVNKNLSEMTEEDGYRVYVNLRNCNGFLAAYWYDIRANRLQETEDIMADREFLEALEKMSP